MIKQHGNAIARANKGVVRKIVVPGEVPWLEWCQGRLRGGRGTEWLRAYPESRGWKWLNPLPLS